MRVALCLYGYYNNRADVDAGDKGLNYIKDNILSKGHDVDIFAHSWDTKNENKILSAYKPDVSVIEPQINFTEISKSAGIDEGKINEGFNRDATMYKTCTVNASLSFFYSRSKAIELALNNARIMDITYDCVIACRFDLGQRSGWHLGYNVSLMNLDFDSKGMQFPGFNIYKELNNKLN